MPLMIEGTEYFSADDVLAQAAVSRQTLWRWRQEGHVPGGRRYRGRLLVFTENELQEVVRFAHRVEPARPSSGAQPD